MPTFGDYETVGEPVSTRELNSGVAIVWRAGKTGNGGSREYAVKCFVPRRSAEAVVREGALEADRGLEFLENIKQLKRIQGPEARLFAPIHGIGTSEDGAWYATDFCRRDLKSHIILRGGVDAQGLRHVCYTLVSGCLALQRACGRSHANLKASNVLLPGPPRPLRRAPIQLVDPRPASLFSSPRLEHADRQDLGELIRDISEVQDLHAIGLIILQLVKGRLFQSSYDYDYPVAPSAEWEKLGSERGRWRELCNRLLDPGLSPAEINLASLAKEFQPGALAGKLPLIGAVAGVMVLAGVGGYAAWHTIEASNHRKMAEWAEDKKKLEAELAAGNEQLAQSNYSGAVASFKEAARRAGNLKDPREQEATNGLNCASWLKHAVEAHGNDDELPDEIKWLEAAETVRQSSAGGEMLKASRGRAGALFTNEMNTGKSFVQKEDYGGASGHYNRAAKWAAIINNDGGRQQAEKEESYAKALDEAEKEERGGNFPEAAKAWQKALDLKPEDAFAKQGLDGLRANEQFTLLLDQAEKAISPKTIPAARGFLKQAGDLASAHRPLVGAMLAGESRPGPRPQDQIHRPEIFPAPGPFRAFALSAGRIGIAFLRHRQCAPPQRDSGNGRNGAGGYPGGRGFSAGGRQ